jgi:hypothetical protein
MASARYHPFRPPDDDAIVFDAMQGARRASLAGDERWRPCGVAGGGVVAEDLVKGAGGRDWRVKPEARADAARTCEREIR